MIRPLYKAQEPFMEVKRGFGYQGVVMYDDDDDTVQCHICGKYLKTLGNHIIKAHKQSVEKYKIDCGLNLTTALCGKSVSRSHSISAKKHYPKRTYLIRTHRRGGRKQIKPLQGARQSMQFKNSQGLCKLQMRARYDVVKKIVGREPTSGDYKKHDRKLFGVICQQYGRINNWRKHVGSSPMNNSEWALIPNTALIASLRKFSHKFHRLPRSMDFQKRGMTPNTSVFYRAFGSWKNALNTAGLIQA